METNNSFDKTLAVFLAKICIQTYNQYTYDGSFDIPDGYTLVEGFKAIAINRPEWFGFIIKSSDNIVVAFRGTQSEIDWLANADAYQTRYSFAPGSGKIHRGFLDIYKSCREQIITTLLSLPASSNIYITGHSLGAALAVINALDIAANTCFKPVMYNFACPRIGNPIFAFKYNRLVTNSIRIVNEHDLVPKLPPVIILAPMPCRILVYQHVKEIYKISFQANSIKGNHDISNYLDALANQFNSPE